MSYYRADTSNNQGWRPGTITLGSLQRGRRSAFRNLNLGDPGFICDISSGACSPCDTATDGDQCVSAGSSQQDQSAQLNQIAQYFQQANTEQISQEQAMVAAARAGVQFSQDLIQQVQQNRNDLESWLGKYNLAYRAAFGSVQSIPGLQGLGVGPVGVIIAAGVLAAILGGIIVVIQHQANTRVQLQTQQQQAQTAGTMASGLAPLQQRIVDAQARGDSAAVAQLTAQYNALLKALAAANPNPTDWSAFFQNNWGWIAAAIGGIVVVKGVLG